MLYRNGRRVGYITGPALYNRVGLTTQMPTTIAIAVNGATRIKDFGTLRMKLLSKRAPSSDSTVPLLEILDILRDARKVPDANVGRIIEAMTKRLRELRPVELNKLQLGMLLTRCQKDVVPALKASLNPTTRFDLGIDSAVWPESQAWNIR